MKYKVIDTGVASAQVNMDIDRNLLNDLESDSEPIIHFYDWSNPSATYGHFIQPEKYLSMDAVNLNFLDLGKRPTGGGVIFHLSDLAFSVLIPSNHRLYSLNTLENYSNINKIVIEAICEFLGKSLNIALFQSPSEKGYPKFCMAQPTVYDVMIEGKKVGGAAQRKTKTGFLHQGSISLAVPPYEWIEKIVLDPLKLINSMREYSFYLIEGDPSKNLLKQVRLDFRNFLLNAFNLNS